MLHVLDRSPAAARRLIMDEDDVPLSALVPLLVELNDLKRVTAAGRPGSVAMHLFADGWASLVAGLSPEAVAWRVAARAVVAARLGAIDPAVLSEAGLSPDEIGTIAGRAIDEFADVLPARLRRSLRDAYGSLDAGVPPPGFVRLLAEQPRAGVTCPGKPRILLEPPENHAEHCLLVAVYGVLLAPRYGAEPARVFLAALAHHFHNAGMPDSGFTGEMLLGQHLQTVMDHYAMACLAELAPPLRGMVEDARAVLPDTGTAEGRTFHAADVLDRVLQIFQYMRASRLTPGQVLEEMELVHAGPVKGFQDEVLLRAGLL